MDAGILLRKEASFRFQMRYTPNGKATTDVTRLGLYFYDKPPRHSMQMDIIYDASLAIPANTKSYSQAGGCARPAPGRHRSRHELVSCSADSWLKTREIGAMLCYESSPCVSERGRGAPLGI